MFGFRGGWVGQHKSGGWVSTNPNVAQICKSIRITGRSLTVCGKAGMAQNSAQYFDIPLKAKS